MSKGAQGGTATYDVYVTNIPPDANERAVREPFMQFGGVQSLNVFDARNGSGRVAFVRFRTEKDADEACKANLEMAGNKLAVRRARRPPAQGAVGGGKKPFGNRSPREAVAGPDIAGLATLTFDCMYPSPGLKGKRLLALYGRKGFD